MPALKVYPQQQPLRGTVTVPGDKSISHRALLLGGLASGESRVQGWLPAGDTLATLEVMRALGVPVHVTNRREVAWDLTIGGQGLHGLQRPDGALDCRNAGTCMRLLAGILAGQPFPSIIDGSEQLRRRPMTRIVTPLRQMGAAIDAAQGSPPLRLQPAELRGIAYRMPIASAQVKSAILLAGLYAAGETRVYEPGPARDHTERMMRAMGVNVVTKDGWVILPAEDSRLLQPLTFAVPGDISSAAFLMVAAAVVPGSAVTLLNVGVNETRSGLLDLLQEMNAAIETASRRDSGGEPVADLTVTQQTLHGITVAGPVVVRAIDEFPAWAVAAAQAEGRSILRDAAELRVKEVDRIARLTAVLHKLGVEVTEQADGFTLMGGRRLIGAVVESHGDHRLAMALAVAGLVADGPVIIADAHCINDSFPGFVETMGRLGAKMSWIEDS
jgi:3-phosphoshikimate 1-carboxyvinyltransferase